jgi:hypothetical protein
MLVMHHEIDGQHYLIEIRAQGDKRWHAAAHSLDSWGPDGVAAESAGASMSAAFAAVLERLVSLLPARAPRRDLSWLGLGSWRALPAQ